MRRASFLTARPCIEDPSLEKKIYKNIGQFKEATAPLEIRGNDI